ncbi:MAG: AI-2E family transporter [Streptococcaceae bacterium]|jgi:predicted PurR-regulated permease PerM|nr:AI-2E family transporter [Streptococcaceae bacterium]
MEKPEQTRAKFRMSYFYKWMVNNKVATASAVLLLLLLNIFLLMKLSFIFTPIADFIGVISLPVVLAAVFYYLLNPIVNFAEKHRVPRLASISVVFVILIGLVIWGLSVAVPSIIDGVIDFSKRVPHYVNLAQNETNQILQDNRFSQFRPQINKTAENFGTTLIDWSKNASTSLVSSLTDVVTKTATVVIDIIVFPFVLFFLLKDGNHFTAYILQFLPQRWRKDTSSVLDKINVQLSAYVRGQVGVALAVTALLLIGLPAIGLRYGVVLAILSGVFNLIPFLGFFLSIVPALVIGLATGGPIMLLKVIVIFAIEQTLESRLISPLILGSQLKIHPITIIFVLLTAGKIWGVWGVLLAIPAYATAKVLVTHIFEWYREISELYENEETEPSSD